MNRPRAKTKNQSLFRTVDLSCWTAQLRFMRYGAGFAACLLALLSLPEWDATLTFDLFAIDAPSWKAWTDQSLFEGERLGLSDIPTLVYLLILFGYVIHECGWTPRLSPAWRICLGYWVFCGLVLGVGLVHGLKWLIGRVRPYLLGNVPITEHPSLFSPWYSFGEHLVSQGFYSGSLPSGHTAAMAALMMLVCVPPGLLTRKSEAQRRLEQLNCTQSRSGLTLITFVIIMAGSLTMAASRSMAGAHWLSDGILSIFLVCLGCEQIYLRVLKIPQRLQAQSSSQLCTGHASIDQKPKDVPPSSREPRAWELRYGVQIVVGLSCLVIAGLGLKEAFRPNAPIWFGLLVFTCMPGVAMLSHVPKALRQPSSL